MEGRILSFKAASSEEIRRKNKFWWAINLRKAKQVSEN